MTQREIATRTGSGSASWISDVERGLGRARYGAERLREVVDVYVEVCASRWATEASDRTSERSWSVDARDLAEMLGLPAPAYDARPRQVARDIGDAVYAALVGGAS